MEREETAVREKEGQGSGGAFRGCGERKWIVWCADDEDGGVMAAEKSVGIWDETGDVRRGDIQ